MKILLISSEFPPDPGGIGNHAYNFALALFKKGYSISVLSNIVKPIELRDHEDLYKVVRIRYNYFAYFLRVYYAVKLSAKNDVIFCSGKFSLWQGCLIKILFNKKIYAIAHGSELDLKNKIPKYLTDFSLLKFNGIVSVSKYTSSFLPNAKYNSEQKRVIIPNGINLSEFQISLKKKIQGCPSLLTVGSLTSRKGQLNVINAMPLLIKEFPNIHYHMVGIPYLKDEIENKAKSLNILSNITIYGQSSREMVLQMLSSCDIFIMLSEHTKDGDFEGFGIAILEANAFGKPAIGSSFGGIQEAINNRISGVLVNPQNQEEIAEALKNILNNYSKYKENSLLWANNHNWNKIINKYIHEFNLTN